MRSFSILHRLAALLLATMATATHAQTLSIQKIDPPNWYAQLPRPMLLVKGEGLVGATFMLSDSKLKIERTTLSGNGHWAQLWLSASSSEPETVRLTATRGTAKAEKSYTFDARRAAGDGMAGFSQQDVLYLILTDRFADGDPTNDGPEGHSAADSAEATSERAKTRGWHGGDLRGIAQHLDDLQGLGITTVWTTPVYQNQAPEAYHGYHATDYYAVDEHYGSMVDLQALVRDLHARHMKLLLDTVPNHVGPRHPWVEDEPSPAWLHGTKAHHVTGETRFDALINPHAPERDRIGTLNGWFVDQLPDVNTDDPAVAQYQRQNAIWWIEQTGADGLRIDTFPYVDRPFWNAFNGELKTLYPHLTEVGEVSNADPEIVSAFADGATRSGPDTHLYTPFDFPFYHAARDIFARGAAWSRLTRVLQSDALYPHPERLVPFLDNHDEPRFAELVRDPAQRNIAYTLLLTSRGTPQLYSGDELAMPGGEDPDNRRDFPNAFTAATRTPDQQQAFAGIQRLLTLRRVHPALQTGEEQILYADGDVLVYSRTLASEHVLVALNKGMAEHSVSFSTGNTSIANLKHTKPLLGTPDAMSLQPHSLALKLSPQAALIFEMQ